MAWIGLIPAAGKGTRLHPLPFSKELYPIGYHEVLIQNEKKMRPKVVSQYLVDHMIRMGAEKIIITLGPGKSDIMDYYGSGRSLGVDIVYNFQSVPRGMPFALDISYPWLKPEDHVVFGMSDTIIEPTSSFVDLKSFYDKESPDLLLALFPTDNPSKFGMVDFDEKNHQVNSTVDKPRSSRLKFMWGACLWNYRFSQFMHSELKKVSQEVTKELVMGDIINSAIQQKLKVKAMTVSHGKYIDIGTIEDLDFALKKFHL